ncbi:SNF2 superfamily RAD5 protein [Jimgerdemannia flammicorona]|uniref:SNF2 superfamily RAD5 protein n=1 Tax=Jimgerdemannia flammicorona TaxID=994334 RepID=A0A433QVI1_9FUNG|nr:SNF2 superfamily RAD5 protein [Jimgerdemannia flammicorona]
MPDSTPLSPTTMSNIPHSPSKKRRFFELDEPAHTSSSPSPASYMNLVSSNPVVLPEETVPPHLAELRAVLGPGVSPRMLEALYKLANGNLDVAVNSYFEGSMKEEKEVAAVKKGVNPFNVLETVKENNEFKGGSSSMQIPTAPANSKKKSKREGTTWARKYIGEFIVIGWSSFKGPNPLHPGDKVLIDRTPPPTPTTKRGKLPSTTRPNTIVRFTTLPTPTFPRALEIGRLPSSTARHVSKLLDLGLCDFDGTVVHCSDRLSTGDDVLLQIRAFLLPHAFSFDPYYRTNVAAFARKPIFDKVAETDLEREAKDRRVAMLALFKALGLRPVGAARPDAGEDAYRENLVAADEVEGPAGSVKKELGVEEDGTNVAEAEEGEKQISEEELDNLYEKAQRFDAALPEMEPARSMVLELRSYQKQALSWMVSKESPETADGEGARKLASLHPLWEEYVFPADLEQGVGAVGEEEEERFYLNPYSEMGLGKTIEILSLIHTNRPILPLPPSTSAPTRHSSPTTLILCPMSLLAQWRDELLRGSAPGTLKVDVYYGGTKDRAVRESCCRWDGRAPDVLVTSYGTVMSEWCAGAEGGRRGLFGVEFWRVVLDEAHQIKVRTTKTARSCFALEAQRRWVVTGTPIQNKLEDLFSLAHFLRSEPWSNYTFWRAHISLPFESKDARALDVVQTVLEPLVLRRTKAMRGPDGTALVQLPDKTIDVEFLDFSPAEQEIYDGLFKDSKRRFSTFVNQGKVLSQYASIFQLLMRLRQVCDHPYLILGGKNSQGEDVVLKDGPVSLDELIAKFDASGSSPGSTDGAPSYGASVLQRLMEGAGADDEQECTICFETLEGGVLMPCMHIACRTCVLDCLQKREDEGEEGQCPICRHGPITEGDLLEVIKRHSTSSSSPSTSSTSKPSLSLRHNTFRSSTKVDALLRHLMTWRRARPGVKTVVFSQFTRMLDLVQIALERDEFRYVRLDGTLPQTARESVLRKFKEETRIDVMLISLKAGGVGLNLTCASRVVVMDPWWNYAVEAQAIDRVHRLGQTEEVIVKRLIIRGSVEEKILAIQNRKNALASGLGMSKDEAKTQRVEDLWILFGEKEV